MNAIPQGASAPLVFQSTTFEVVDRNGQQWLRVSQIGRALGYADDKAIQRLYARNASEFTDGMTGVVKLTTPSGEQEVRIFSLRGAHLLGMFARTKAAADFRRWVLDILDRETAPAAPIGDALKASIAEAVKQAIAAQMAPAPAQLPAMKMSIDPRRLIDLMTDLRKIYARLDALGMVASDLPPKWWDQHAVHGIGEPVSRG